MPKRINPGLREDAETMKAESFDLRRFFSKLLPITLRSSRACWRWAGHKDRLGYGQFSLRGRKVWAHRFSFVALGGGVIGNGEEVHHLCGNPSCVNPQHLRAVPMPENRRSVRRRRHA